MGESTIRDAAIALAAKGFAVLPIKPRGKIPCSEHGFKDATRDPQVIEAWLVRWPEMNLAVRTGEAGDLLVIDVDAHHGGLEAFQELVKEHGPLPRTVRARTPNGGVHLWFRHVPGLKNLVGKLAPGVDLRTEGACAVVPPSRTEQRSYRWEPGCSPFETEVAACPPWLEKLVTEASQSRVSTKPTNARAERLAPKVGERNQTLAGFVGSLFARGLDEEEVLRAALGWNLRISDPLPEAEVERTVASIATTAARKRADLVNEDEATATWPQPADPAAFDGFAGKCVSLIDPYTEADPHAVLFALLAAVGAAIGPCVSIKVGTTPHHVNLFGLLVGPTGAGKGAATGIARTLVEYADLSWTKIGIRSGLVSGEGLVHAVRDQKWVRRKTKDPAKGDGFSGSEVEELVDPGAPTKNVLFIEEEFGRTLRSCERQGNVLGPLIRGAFDGGDLEVSSKSEPEKSTSPHVAILGNVTPSELLDLVGAMDALSGQLNRFMMIATRRSKDLPSSPSVPDEILEQLGNELAGILEWARQQGTLTWSPEVQQIKEATYRLLTDPEGGDLIRGLLARARVHVLRLAMLYALLDRSCTVEVHHYRAALALWAYSERSCRYFFASRFDDGLETRVLEALRESGAAGMTRTELHRQLDNHVKGPRLRSILQDLEAQRRVRCASQAGEGRPAQRWFAVELGQAGAGVAAKEAKEAKKGVAAAPVPKEPTLNSHNSLLSQASSPPPLLPGHDPELGF